MSLELFEEVLEFPQKEIKSRYDSLVGLENEKRHLLKQSQLLLNSELLTAWSKNNYNTELNLLKYVKNRPHLFIFSGDVGTGKTSLAETFGDAVARQEKIEITLYRLSLKARGNGTVGDMTKMISTAFATVVGEGKKNIARGKKLKNAFILVIDEADALAQSRESMQMHHEDRAGVNALIRGIDTVSLEELPVLVVMCTNRVSAIDPAVLRRAAFIFSFTRPNEIQRRYLIESAFNGTGVKGQQIDEIVKKTGVNELREFGFTYSDITQRFLPAVVTEFFPDHAIDFDKVIEIASTMSATPPFKDENI